MRTTLTVDNAIGAELKRIAREEGRSFKEVVNETLRRGLASRGHPPADRKPYRLHPFSLGGPLSGIDLDKALRLAEAVEDEESRRKLEMRK